MFGKRPTVVAINKYLDAYKVTENFQPRLSKSLSSTFLKAVRNCEDEVAAKLKEGNPDDHVRHEEYVLSYLPEPLKNQVYSYVNRGLANSNTIDMLKKYMTEDSWDLLLKSLVEMMKPVYVEPNKYIFDPNAPGSSKWCGLMLLRHGEGYYVVNGSHENLTYLDCIDMMGVTEHAFCNLNEIPYERVQIVSRSACIVGVLTFLQLINAVKALPISDQEINNVLSFLLARSIRLENEQKRRLQEAEMRRQETLRHHLSDWRVYLQAGDVMNVSRYVMGGFDINSNIGVLGDKPLIIAISSQSTNLVKYLLENGANVNATNENGTTALHVACQLGWNDGIVQLLSSGARFLPDKQGNTPLHIAAQQNSRKTIELLIQLKKAGNKDIDWEAKNKSGEKPVDCCCDIDLKRIIVPKGTDGYTFARDRKSVV